MLRRIVICVMALAAIAVFLFSLESSRKPLLILSLLSTELSDDGVYLVAKLCLSNGSSRIWTYMDSSVPSYLWRIRVKEKNRWRDGLTGQYAGSAWSQKVQMRPGESRILHVALPADGAERMVGTFLQLDGVRSNSKPAVFVRDLYYRLLHRSLLLPGQYCAWSTNIFSHRALIDRGLLATNHLRRLTFDATPWKSANAEEKLAMARDLETSGLLIGRSKFEVLEMLGPGINFRDETGYWLLGFQQCNPLDFPEKRLLMVRLDEKGRVRTVEIHIVL